MRQMRNALVFLREKKRGLKALIVALLAMSVLYIVYHPRRVVWGEGIVNVWRTRKFTPFTNREQIASLFDQIPVDLQTSLDEAQYKALKETVVELLDIYRITEDHLKVCERYLQFAQKRKGNFSERMKAVQAMPSYRLSLGEYPMLVNLTSEQASEMIKNPEVRKKYEEEGKRYARELYRGWKWPPQTAADVFRARWHSYYHKKGVWTGIDLRDAKITVFESPWGTLPMDYVMNQTRRFGNEVGGQALYTLPSLFDFPITSTQGKNKYARVYFMAQHHDPDPPWPTYLWLRWEDSVSNWILDKSSFLYGGTRKGNSDLLF
jgi:hypothetical protein